MPKPFDQLISVVLPAHNETASLAIVIEAVRAELQRLDIAREIIVIDDGSTDGTRALMLALCAADPTLRYLRFSRNFGKEAAISAGLASARGAAAIIMDADGQHPATLLPTFIEHWRSGAEIVYASQTRRADPAWLRFFKNSYYHMMKAGSSVKIPPNAGDFRLLDRKVIDAINALPERNRFMKGLYGWVGFRSQNVPFDAAPRIAGASRYSLRRLISLGLTGLTSFSVVPLRFVSVAGMLVSAVSVVYGCWLLYEHFATGGKAPPGWSTLAVGMMFLSGLQLLCLGVIGEYLGRIFQEVKARPLYVVAEDSTASLETAHASEPAMEARVHQAVRRQS
jgi:glycosyltransferase involved in cell wall biosynthesis